jgi:glycosyltransferase involved in cell wall biosynthesis
MVLNKTQEKKQPKVLLFFAYFFPAYKSGGPARSSLALVEHLEKDAIIKVLTNAYDFGDNNVLEGIQPDRWNLRNETNIFYFTTKGYWKKIINTINNSNANVYHFNSFFSFRFTIFPLLLIKLGLLRRLPIVLSPRGEFSEAALGIKGTKKKFYIIFFKLIMPRIIFHATNENEKINIFNVLKIDQNDIRVAPNLRCTSDYEFLNYTIANKEKNKLKIIFLGRISRIKNIEFCIQVLQKVKSDIIFDYYGIPEDKAYLNIIEEQVRKLPKNIIARYCGELQQHEVIPAIQGYDLLFFPSKGENFGHVILESLLAARPVLISDQTFWLNLKDANAGWDLPLNRPDKFVEVIELLTSFDKEEYSRYNTGAFNRAMEYINNQNNLTAYLDMYNNV